MKGTDASGSTKRIPAALKEKRTTSHGITRRDPAEASTSPNVLEQSPSGSGSGSERSSKGGKSGGGMGGQQSGGIKGGGKRKTHAGRK